MAYVPGAMGTTTGTQVPSVGFCGLCWLGEGTLGHAGNPLQQSSAFRPQPDQNHFLAHPVRIAATKSGSIYHKQGQRMDLGEMLGTLVRIQTLLILQSSAAGLQQNLFLHAALAQHKVSYPMLPPLVKCRLRERQQGCPVSLPSTYYTEGQGLPEALTAGPTGIM